MTDNWFNKKSTEKSSDSHFTFLGVPLSTLDHDRRVLADTLYVPV